MTTFKDLGLAETLLRALADEGYSTPTPIQVQAIPPVLRGHDVVGAAQTGTGKTAAFGLPLLQRLAAEPRKPAPRSVRVLILAPTRELASQIEESLVAYGRYCKPTTATAFGGVPIGRQRRALQNGLDILVATPGRLLDLVDQGDLKLGTVEVLVLDEADRMLDLGFIHALKRIASLLPRERQSLFFSATMPPPIRELAARFLRPSPVEVAVAPVATAAETVDQRVIMTRADRKPALLAHVLGEIGRDLAIVFTRTKHGADKVVRLLDRAGIPANAIHGNKSQPQRERALEAFKSGATPILIATDIAARGIDVDGVGLVVNYDLPNIPESYVHRIGRTGRAGASGRAVAFCTSEETAFLADIEKLMRRKVPRMDEPDGIVYAAPAIHAAAGAAPSPRSGSGRQPERSGRGDRAPASRGENRGERRPAQTAAPERGEAAGRGRPAKSGQAPSTAASPAPRGGQAPRGDERRPAREDRPVRFAERTGREDRGGRAETRGGSSFGSLVREISGSRPAGARQDRGARR
ncbi:DEAD/DEAH box helicase [Prosthecomicrobium sp. N25]|uniref:DEAD/DEAH box helicase n=1 Tax=Prosthecomicrobium sp. N25 TaxID=3129254 RepID=UPI0030787782